MKFLRQSETCNIVRRSFLWQLFVVEFIDVKTKDINTVLCFSFGKISNDSLLRINSPCLTSETFDDDNRCDCRDQLEKAIEIIQDHGSGFILYNLQEEGRGNGIFNKINSYHAMSTMGLTTKCAFEYLDLPIDNRGYEYIKYFANYYQFTTITMLTNNSGKITAVERLGIQCSRMPIVINNPILADYLQSKADEFGHHINVDF